MYCSSIFPQPYIHTSIDWFTGKFPGKSNISRENLWFPVDFPLRQPIEYHMSPLSNFPRTASPSLRAFLLIIRIIISDLAAIDYLTRVSTLVSEQGLSSSEEILVPQ